MDLNIIAYHKNAGRKFTFSSSNALSSLSTVILMPVTDCFSLSKLLFLISCTCSIDQLNVLSAMSLSVILGQIECLNSHIDFYFGKSGFFSVKYAIISTRLKFYIQNAKFVFLKTVAIFLNYSTNSD